MKTDTLLLILGVGGIALVLGIFGAFMQYGASVVEMKNGTKIVVHVSWRAVGMGFLGVVLIAIGIAVAYNFRGGETLPVVPGTVLSISSRIGSFRNPTTREVEEYEGLNVEFTYSIDDVTYHTVGEALLNEKTRFWDVGDTIRVYYYPMFPNSPLLFPVDSQVIYEAIGFGINFLLVACLWTSHQP
jgi:hypothetical protein